jgi:hypothetical protein
VTLGIDESPTISLELGCKVRMVGEHEPPQAMRLRAICTPYPLPRSDADPRVGHSHCWLPVPWRVAVWVLRFATERVKPAPVSRARSDVRSPVQPRIWRETSSESRGLNLVTGVCTVCPASYGSHRAFIRRPRSSTDITLICSVRRRLR